MVANKAKAGNALWQKIKYEIVERIAVLGERPRGWERQLNMVSWNGNPPKYDIRDWSPDAAAWPKGIS